MNVNVHHEVVYSTVPGFRPLELDLYVGPHPRAICVWLHGGGWRMGTRRNGPGPRGTGRTHLLRAAERGLAMAAVEYRLSGEATFPAQLDDVVAACRFLLESGSDYAIDGLPLVMWGTSAGGHLAGLCSLSTSVGESVRAVASWSAPIDFAGLPSDRAAMGEPEDQGSDSREALLLGAPGDQVPDLQREASPLSHVRRVDAPFLLVHGSADRAMPLAQTERFGAALEAAGNDVTTMVVDGADHFYGGISSERLTEVVDTTTDFLLAAAT